MAENPDSSSTPSLAMISSRPALTREDCWNEDATSFLIEAWEQRYIELNRGNLRQKQWQKDVQCKNQIDTSKKKYMIEKARVLDSNGSYK